MKKWFECYRSHSRYFKLNYIFRQDNFDSTVLTVTHLAISDLKVSKSHYHKRCILERKTKCSSRRYLRIINVAANNSVVKMQRNTKIVVI